MIPDNTEDKPGAYHITLRSPQGWQFPNPKTIWEYRELVYFLTLRDLKPLYKQTVLGYAWLFITPIFNMLLYGILFGMLAKLPSDNVPYILFLFTGQIAWAFFSNVFNAANNSLKAAATLTAKIYFPRLVITLSSSFSSLANILPMFIILIILLLWFKTPLRWEMVFLLPLALFAILTGYAIGIWFSALSVKYRDVAQSTTMFITVWMYASPIVYSPSMIPVGILQYLYFLNPMAGIINGFRWALLGVDFPVGGIMIIFSFLIVIGILILGLAYFQRVEQTFIDMM